MSTCNSISGPTRENIRSALAHLQLIAVLLFWLALGSCTAAAQPPGYAQHPLYHDVIAIPDKLKTGLERIIQPWQHAKNCNPDSVACVPTSAGIVLGDRGIRIDVEMAAGKYAPLPSGGTVLKSAAAVLHRNGVPSNLYIAADIKGNPYILRQLAQNRQPAIVGWYPGSRLPGHAMVVDGVAVINNTHYYVMRDPWPLAPYDGHFLKPQATLEAGLDSVVEPLAPGARPDPRFDPQRKATGGPFKGLGGDIASQRAEPQGRCARAREWLANTTKNFDDWLQAKLGIDNDLTKLNPTRRQINEAARRIGPVVDKLFMGLAAAASAQAFKTYLDHIAAATDPSVTDAEAQKHFEQANLIALQMAESGAWGIAWGALGKATPTGAAVLGSFAFGYEGGRWLLENTKTGKEIDAGSRSFFDWVFGNLDDDRGGPLTADRARRLLDSYQRAIDAGQIRLQAGATLGDLARAVRAGNFRLIHNAVIEEVPARDSEAECADGAPTESFSLVFVAVEPDKAWEGWTVAPGRVTQKSPHGWHSEHTWNEPPLVIDQEGFTITLSVTSTSIEKNRLAAGTALGGDFRVVIEQAIPETPSKPANAPREEANAVHVVSENGKSESKSKTIKVTPKIRPAPGGSIALKVGAAWGPGVTYRYTVKTQEAKK